MRFIDPYGETVFNRGQCGVLRDEWAVLTEGAPENLQRWINDVADLIERCAAEVHLRSLAERPARDADFWKTLAGLEFWGGSGAVREIGPFHLSDPSIAMPPSDYRRFKALMVELAGILDSRGLGARASGIAEVFRSDLEAGS